MIWMDIDHMKFSFAPNRESVTVGSAGGLFFDKRHVIGFLWRVEVRVSCCHPVPLRKLVFSLGALEYCAAINSRIIRTRDKVENNGGVAIDALFETVLMKQSDGLEMCENSRQRVVL